MSSPSTTNQRRPRSTIAPETPTSTHAVQLEFPLLLACFFLSGLAALVYQTAWMRQFAVVFGTSELAIATVLSAYMAGLAAGSTLAGRFLKRLRRPVLAYGILEFLIAAGALLVPVGLRIARWLQVLTLGGQPAPPDAGGWMQPALYVATTFVVLFLPTACMGATLPLLTSHAVRRQDQIGSRVGLLYAFNTLGAVFGTLIAGFLLLPALGLFRTTLCGVFVNMLVFGVAFLLARLNSADRADPGTASASVSDDQVATTNRRSPATRAPAEDRAPVVHWYRGTGWLLPMMLVSGMVSFTYEVLWSRLLGHLIGGSVHAFATMLATFLTGITFGSMIASRLAWSRHSGLLGFLIAQCGTALFSMLTYAILDFLPEWIHSQPSSGPISPIATAVRCSLVLLPSTLFIGATFPFAVRAMTETPEEAGPISARVYAWNTVGGVIGAVLAGFIIVPELQFAGTAQLAIGVNLLLATCALWLLTDRLPLRVGALAGLLMYAAIYHPGIPYRILTASTFQYDTRLPERVKYLGVGRSSTVMVKQESLIYRVSNNGLPEAVISPKGTPPIGREVHLWLSALPLLARPDAESMLVIGFGSGGAAQSIPQTVRDIDVIELEPLIIEANREMAPFRANDPLSDPRVNVIINDARGALALTDKRYDIIISQPSHPWTAGASHLYTREFMQSASDHLTEDGVYLQWMNSQFIDGSLFKALGQTLLDVFPYVRLYMPGTEELLFIASAAPMDIERQLWQSRDENGLYPFLTGDPDRLTAYETMGINGVNDIAASLVLDTEGLRRVCAGAPLTTDDQNRLAFASSHNRAAISDDELHDLFKVEDVLLRPDSPLNQPADLPLNPAIIAHRLSRLGLNKRLVDYVLTRTERDEWALVRGILEMNRGEARKAAELFLEAYNLNPQRNDAAFWLCEMASESLARDPDPGPPLSPIIAQLTEPEATVLKACIALNRDDFAAIARLEEPLSRVSPEKSCYGRSLRCRAGWRAGSTRAPNREKLAAEAVLLADQASAITPGTINMTMRLNAVAMLRNAPAIMETALQILMNLKESTFDSAAKFLTEGGGAHVILTQLEKLRGNPEVDQHRLQDIITNYEEWIRAIQPKNSGGKPAG